LSSWTELDYQIRPECLDPQAVKRWVERTDSAGPPSNASSQLEKSAWQIGFLLAAQAAAVDEAPSVQVVDHGWLCESPAERIESVARASGLVWTDDARDFVLRSNRAGSGYEARRIASQEPGRWRTRLSRTQIEDAVAVLHQFPAVRPLLSDL
jgi:hypothetical protein